MKPYSKLTAQEQANINIKSIINFNHYTLQSAVQNILQHSTDTSLHTEINTSLERCIKDIGCILLKHSKNHESKTKNTTNEDA